MVVVDTNVLAYLLIDGDHTSGAQALYARDPDWRSEGFALVELSNVLVTYVRAGALDRATARELLDAAQRVVTGTVNLPHRRALDLAHQHGVSAYDARFLGAAQALGARLVTEDLKLRKSAPLLTHSLDQALSA